MKVHIIQDKGRRAATICKHFRAGIVRSGGEPVIYPSPSYPYYRSDPELLLMYGYGEPRRSYFQRAMKRGIPVIYVDLGYWHRTRFDRYDGYHKVCLNALHPTDYFMRRQHNPKRFEKLAIPIEKQKRGDAILIPGMSEKAAWTWGFKAEEWEKKTIARLRKHTDRRIIYRPKPSWRGKRPLRVPGVEYDDPRHPIERILKDTFCVVTHHSNVAVDGLLRGIPNISDEGVGSVIGTNDLAMIEQTEAPDMDEVRAWAANVAWTQWTPEEMHSGAAWRYVLEELRGADVTTGAETQGEAKPDRAYGQAARS